MEIRSFHIIDDEISSMASNYKASHICLALYALFFLTRFFDGVYVIAVIVAVAMLLSERRNEYVRFSASQCLSLSVFYIAIRLILLIVSIFTFGFGAIFLGPIYLLVRILFAIFEILNLYFIYNKKCWRMPIVADIADKINAFLPSIRR